MGRNCPNLGKMGLAQLLNQKWGFTFHPDTTPVIQELLNPWIVDLEDKQGMGLNQTQEKIEFLNHPNS